jgi:SAM-dependent methyltransferase
MTRYCVRVLGLIFAFTLAFPAFGAANSTVEQAFEPIVGQEGKDVVWVPSPQAMVEKMLDLAKVTPQDFVIDLGSGDGRNVIAAAKRGARALGVEYNEKMVELSKRAADKEGVGERAQFVQGDMYEADISKATVLALFLLPDNLNKLLPKFLDLKPGTRIVANHFGMKEWKPDVVERAEKDCEPWCTALLYIVPAKVAGAWRLDDGSLSLEQQYQEISGLLKTGATETPVSGRVDGDAITLNIGTRQYIGRVSGDTMTGDAWRAARVAK